MDEAHQSTIPLRRNSCFQKTSTVMTMSLRSRPNSGPLKAMKFLAFSPSGLGSIFHCPNAGSQAYGLAVTFGADAG